MADHEHIDTLKAAADPQRVAVALGLHGRGNRFRCPDPGCVPSDGRPPDLSLSVGDKGFVCHRCGLKGDILKLIEVAAGLDFPSAVRWLEDLTGIPSPVRHKKRIGKTTGRGGIGLKSSTMRILGKLIKEGQNKGEIAGKGNVTGNNQYGNVQRDNISSRLIDSFSVVDAVKCDQMVTPATESQTRPLARLEPDQQREAWQKAVATAPEGKELDGKTTGRGGIVQPGASCEAVRPDPVKTTGPAVDPSVYEAFLTACRPVEGRALDFLVRDKGVAPDVVISLGLRFCGREYQDIMNALTIRFGEDALLVAGLLKRSKAGGRLVPSFWHYYAKKAGFLVIPYLLDGRPVYLKARPPVSKADAERLDLVRFMNTAAAVPCLYNADALKGQPGRVLICEGESDTWTALSYGFPAVGSPGAKNFKEAWVEDFRGMKDADGRSRVFLILDADKAGGEGSLTIARLFQKAGLPVPLKIELPPGMDLTDYMKEGIMA